jgi:preprotein translocase subunit SecE
MQSSYTDIMEAVRELEAVLYGNPAQGKKGIVEKVNNHEDFIKEIRDIFRKILWAAVLGALATVANVVLNTRSIAVQQHQSPPAAQQK